MSLQLHGCGLACGRTPQARPPSGGLAGLALVQAEVVLAELESLFFLFFVLQAD
jgi:hypothetical protein